MDHRHGSPSRAPARRRRRSSTAPTTQPVPCSTSRDGLATRLSPGCSTACSARSWRRARSSTPRSRPPRQPRRSRTTAPSRAATRPTSSARSRRPSASRRPASSTRPPFRLWLAGSATRAATTRRCWWMARPGPARCLGIFAERTQRSRAWAKEFGEAAQAGVIDRWNELTPRRARCRARAPRQRAPRGGRGTACDPQCAGRGQQRRLVRLRRHGR